MRRAVTMLLLALAALALPSGAQASCGLEVLNDLVAHEGQVVAAYHPQDCYRDALANLGDNAIYTDYAERIGTAMRRDATGGSRTLAAADGGILAGSGPDQAGTIPMPVIVGAGLALLLVVSGGVAALVRRRQI